MKVNIKKAFSKKRIAALVIILVAVFIMLVSNPEINNFLSENNSVKLNFQTGVEYDMSTYGKVMLLVNNEGIYAVDERGREAWSSVAPTTSPYVSVNGNYIMLADINGKSLKTYKKEKTIAEIETENEIFCAKLNKNGYVAVATDEIGYKGMVTLYDKNGKELFKWHSGTGYIGDIEISPKNNIAVAQIATDKDKLYTRIIEIKPKDSEEPECLAEIEGIVMKLKYRDNGSLIAVSDNALYGFKASGKQRFKVDYQGRSLVDFNVENERNMVLAFDNGLNNTLLESYSSSGEKRGTFDGKSEIHTLDVNGECIVASRHDGIFKITPSGEVKKDIKANNDVKDIKIFSSRDNIISLGVNTAEIIEIK